MRILVLLMMTALMISTTGCSLLSRRPAEPAADPNIKQNAIESALALLSLQKLDQANLVFRVAFEKSLDSWQGPGDDAVVGCKITSKDAEIGLAAIKPWFQRRANEEAKRAVDAPKSYALPIDAETCEQDCSCGVGLAILDAAELDSQSHQKVKELKRVRTRLEAKSELLTRDRAELCAERMTWICSSEVLKAIQPARPTR